MQPPDWVWYMLPIICVLWAVDMSLRLYVMRLKRKLAEAEREHARKMGFLAKGIAV